MLEMPQLIRAWKTVSFLIIGQSNWRWVLTMGEQTDWEEELDQMAEINDVRYGIQGFTRVYTHIVFLPMYQQTYIHISNSPARLPQVSSVCRFLEEESP
jgi:hypothetical protein